VLIDVSLPIVTEVGATLFMNVAILSGTIGLEDQFVPVVHSVPGPDQVPSTACATSETKIENPSPVPAKRAAAAADRTSAVLDNKPRMNSPRDGAILKTNSVVEARFEIPTSGTNDSNRRAII